MVTAQWGALLNAPRRILSSLLGEKTSASAPWKVALVLAEGPCNPVKNWSRVEVIPKDCWMCYTLTVITFDLSKHNIESNAIVRIIFRYVIWFLTTGDKFGWIFQSSLILCVIKIRLLLMKASTFWRVRFDLWKVLFRSSSDSFTTSVTTYNVWSIMQAVHWLW